MSSTKAKIRWDIVREIQKGGSWGLFILFSNSYEKRYKLDERNKNYEMLDSKPNVTLLKRKENE